MVPSSLATRATTLEEVKAQINHLKYYVHRQRKATHEIAAWRLMVSKAGKTGVDGPDDFELIQGSKGDGESWAGGKVMAVIGAVVIVSRWCVLLIIYLFWFMSFCRRLNIYLIILGMEERFSVQRNFRLVLWRSVKLSNRPRNCKTVYQAFACWMICCLASGRHLLASLPPTEMYVPVFISYTLTKTI